MYYTNTVLVVLLFTDWVYYVYNLNCNYFSDVSSIYHRKCIRFVENFSLLAFDIISAVDTSEAKHSVINCATLIKVSDLQKNEASSIV